MKISIALATYNGADFLTEQLNSIAAQSVLPDEIVISDDCSTDNTEVIINDFILRSSLNVVYVKNKSNMGYSANFNTALMKTSGDLVFLCDQDDVWFPNKIETILNLANTYPDILVFMNDALITDSALNEAGLTKIGQLRSGGFDMSMFVMGCCMCVRRELLNLCLPIDPKYKAHDDWIAHFSDAFDSKLVIDTVLQYYRRHGKNESIFIANNTSKINKFDVLKQAFLRNIKKSKKGRSDSLKLKIEQLSCLNEALVKLSNKTSINNKRVNAYQKGVEAELNKFEQSFVIRELSLFKRLLKVLKRTFGGGYVFRKDWKLILKDIFG